MLLNNIGAVFCYNHPPRPDPNNKTRLTSLRFQHRRDSPPSPAKVHWKKRYVKQQSICTADELHHISIPNSDWKLALWRYLPSPEVCKFSTLWCFWIPFWECNGISSGVVLISLFISKIKERWNLHLKCISW